VTAGSALRNVLTVMVILKPRMPIFERSLKGTSAQTLALILFDEKNDDNLFVDR